jgi:hypothetical protein
VEKKKMEIVQHVSENSVGIHQDNKAKYFAQKSV